MLETLALILLAVMAGLLWAIVARQRTMEDRLARLDRLDDIRAHVAKIADSGGKLAGERGDIDLRRLEHVLIDMRDGQKRLEEKLLALAEVARKEATRAPESAESVRAPERPTVAALTERVHNRLLAMGYERIEIVTPFEELSALLEAGGDGELVAEARRAGASCKGRIRLRGGAIAAVDLSGSHAMFP